MLKQRAKSEDERAKILSQKKAKIALLFALCPSPNFSWFSPLKKVNLPSFVKRYFYPGIH
jgi:hypothetical protein